MDLTRDEPLHCDIDPVEYEPPRARLVTLKARLETVVKRYPDIRISISGRAADLRSMELASGAGIFLVNHLCIASIGQAGEAGKVRLRFARDS